MCKLSDIIGKSVVSLWNAAPLGKLNGAFCDEMTKKLLRYETERGSSFSPADIISVGDDAIIIGDPSAPNDGVPCPVGLTVYSVSGRLMGVLSDLELKGDKITALVIGGENVEPGKLVARSETVAVVNDVKMRLVKKEKLPETTTATSDSTALLPVKARRESGIPSSKSGSGSYDFLLGKCLSRTVTKRGGEIIAEEGCEITRELIERAEKEGRLVQLALHAQ